MAFALQGVECGRQVQHAYSEVFARHNLSLVYLHCRDSEAALESAQLGYRLAEEQGFGFLAAWGRYLLAWALAMSGDAEPAKAEIAAALDAPRASAPTTDSYLNVFLAQAYWHLGDWRSGLAVVGKAATVKAYEVERLWLVAEFNRLKAESPECDGDTVACYAAAEQYYREALALSRQQGALGCMRRVLVDLAGFLENNGRGAEADALQREYLPSSGETRKQ